MASSIAVSISGDSHQRSISTHHRRAIDCWKPASFRVNRSTHPSAWHRMPANSSTCQSMKPDTWPKPWAGSFGITGDKPCATRVAVLRRYGDTRMPLNMSKAVSPKVDPAIGRITKRSGQGHEVARLEKADLEMRKLAPNRPSFEEPCPLCLPATQPTMY